MSRFCMPINEAKSFISNGPFDVLAFNIVEGKAVSILQKTTTDTLYVVQYFTAKLGDIGCFVPITGGQPV